MAEYLRPWIVDSEGPTIHMSDGTTQQPAWGPGSRLESGPQSEAQWLDEAGADMSDEEVAAWIETL